MLAGNIPFLEFICFITQCNFKELRLAGIWFCLLGLWFFQVVCYSHTNFYLKYIMLNLIKMWLSVCVSYSTVAIASRPQCYYYLTFAFYLVFCRLCIYLGKIKESSITSKNFKLYVDILMSSKYLYLVKTQKIFNKLFKNIVK